MLSATPQGKGAVFSPTDLVATGLVTCMMTIMGINARKLKVDVKGMEITVTKEMSKSLPRRIARLPVTIKFPMELTEDQKRSLVRAANYCPVRESLRQDIDRWVQGKRKKTETSVHCGRQWRMIDR